MRNVQEVVGVVEENSGTGGSIRYRHSNGGSGCSRRYRQPRMVVGRRFNLIAVERRAVHFRLRLGSAHHKTIWG